MIYIKYEPNTPMTGAIGRDVQAGSKLGHERLSNATEEAV